MKKINHIDSIKRPIITEKATILQSLNISKIRLEEEEATSKFTLSNVLNQIKLF